MKIELIKKFLIKATEFEQEVTIINVNIDDDNAINVCLGKNTDYELDEEYLFIFEKDTEKPEFPFLHLHRLSDIAYMRTA